MDELFSDLPSDFAIGCATSAFQVEGSQWADGRGPSIWDARAGVAARAVGHHDRWQEDLALISGLGVDAYRFSVSWPRVQPDGGGAFVGRALDEYRRRVTDLRDVGVAPVVCLYHWDLPQALQDAGGWQARETAERFAEYAAATASALGDEVALWVTLNEPFMHLLRGHIVGDHAPGLRLEEWSAVAHHLLLGHGLGVKALRAASAGARVGVIENVAPVRPVSDEPGAQMAAAVFGMLSNDVMLGTMLTGAYPKPLLALRPPPEGLLRDGDMATISTPLDLLGINYYGPIGITAPAPGGPPFAVADLPGLATTELGTMIDPAGLREVLVGLAERYGDALPPLAVTEVGRDAPDELVADGTCRDEDRVDFLTDHLSAVAAAIRDGVDVRGFFVWSLLDSFEWEHGLGPRYGLVHVDFETLRRTPKRSYEWLAAGLGRRASVRSDTPGAGLRWPGARDA